MHNLCNSLTKIIAFIEHAEKCRQLMYHQFADKDPRYNHHSYIEWKQLCMGHFVGPGVVRMRNLNHWYGVNSVKTILLSTGHDQAILLARETPEMYHRIKEIFHRMHKDEWHPGKDTPLQSVLGSASKEKNLD